MRYIGMQRLRKEMEMEGRTREEGAAVEARVVEVGKGREEGTRRAHGRRNGHYRQ